MKRVLIFLAGLAVMVCIGAAVTASYHQLQTTLFNSVTITNQGSIYTGTLSADTLNYRVSQPDTNQASTRVIDFGQENWAIKTNNNINLVGMTNIVAARNKIQKTIIWFGNTAGSLKTITLPLGMNDLRGTGNPINNTNGGFLTVYYGEVCGTNWVWAGN